jgi:hypothetical protein
LLQPRLDGLSGSGKSHGGSHRFVP